VASKPYLSYYGEHGIVPVRQDTSDLRLHLSRRHALYRQLGILPLTFRNRSILELGPGTGDNALFLASCEPGRCVLVDGNPASIQVISKKINEGLLPREVFECRIGDILDWRDAGQFDIVLCEGVIPGQENPEAFLAHVASFAGNHGIVVTTTISAPSVLAEVCRRVIKPIIAEQAGSRENLLRELTNFFEPDLRSLPGMSRLHEDWVLDNILHPWPARIVFSIPEAIDSLDDDFDVLGTSPCFIQDWRWYKAIPRHEKTWNVIAREEYERWAPYLLDYRIQPSDPIPTISAQLDAVCTVAVGIHHRIWHQTSLNEIPQFIDCLREIRNIIVKALPETASAIADFLRGLNGLLDGDKSSDFGSFRRWFGRGQQYVSFMRK